MRPSQAERDIAAIESLLARSPQGLNRAQLEAGLLAVQRPIQWRTMLRRLKDLQLRGRIIAEGRGRATLYRSAQSPNSIPSDFLTPSEQATSAEERDRYVPLSPDGEAVRALVRTPLASRPSVGYNASFLEQYQPGHTWYLTEAMRDKLHQLGRTPDADRPAGTYAREILANLLIDLSWASSRLEGNKYTRLDTKRLIEFGQAAEGKDAKETQMILNHRQAIELLVDQADLIGFNRYTFSNLHSALSQNLVGNERDEGRVRTGMVSIAGSAYAPLAIPQRLEELFGILLNKADAIPDPFEQAFFVMVQLPYLQPFIDVNKRTSRLGANIPLIKANLCPLSFIGVPELAYVEGTLGVYEFNRIELLRDVFLWAYQRSCEQYLAVREALGMPDPIRLRYHSALAEVVRETVLHGVMPQPSELRTWAAEHHVALDDQESFAEIAERLLLELHEGSIARYSLRPSEFQSWKTRIGARPV